MLLLIIRIDKYHYLLVDEHQDSNTSQNKIVELISNYFQNPNLFIVGDEKQAIFRFQGATIANFFKFREKYPDAKLVNLSDNYRSTKNILDSSFFQNDKIVLLHQSHFVNNVFRSREILDYP